MPGVSRSETVPSLRIAVLDDLFLEAAPLPSDPRVGVVLRGRVGEATDVAGIPFQLELVAA